MGRVRRPSAWPATKPSSRSTRPRSSPTPDPPRTPRSWKPARSAPCRQSASAPTASGSPAWSEPLFVIAVDPLPSARERALLVGAEHALDPTADDFTEAVHQATAGRGIDVAFVFAGVEAARAQAPTVLGPNGVLVLAGLTPEPVTVADSIDFCCNVRQIRGHLGSEPEHVEQFVGLATAGRIDLGPSVSAHVPPADAADAVARLEKKIGDPIRLVLTP
ncbi:zinc-binding dehydrogenase [Streptomyces viridiviolaceus]